LCLCCPGPFYRFTSPRLSRSRPSNQFAMELRFFWLISSTAYARSGTDLLVILYGSPSGLPESCPWAFFVALEPEVIWSLGRRVRVCSAVCHFFSINLPLEVPRWTWSATTPVVSPLHSLSFRSIRGSRNRGNFRVVFCTAFGVVRFEGANLPFFFW